MKEMKAGVEARDLMIREWIMYILDDLDSVSSIRRAESRHK